MNRSVSTFLILVAFFGLAWASPANASCHNPVNSCFVQGGTPPLADAQAPGPAAYFVEHATFTIAAMKGTPPGPEPDALLPGDSLAPDQDGYLHVHVDVAPESNATMFEIRFSNAFGFGWESNKEWAFDPTTEGPFHADFALRVHAEANLTHVHIPFVLVSYEDGVVSDGRHDEYLLPVDRITPVTDSAREAPGLPVLAAAMLLVALAAVARARRT